MGDDESPQSTDPLETVESLSDSVTDRESPLSPESSLMGDDESENEMGDGTPSHI